MMTMVEARAEKTEGRIPQGVAGQEPKARPVIRSQGRSRLVLSLCLPSPQVVRLKAAGAGARALCLETRAK